MSGTLAVYGVMGSTLACALAGTIGAKAVFAATADSGQRRVLKRIFAWSGPYVAALMSIVLLATLQVITAWAYALALVLWFAPLLPALTWAHQQLDAVTGEAGPAAAPAAG